MRFSSFEERRPLQEAQEEENVSGFGAGIQAMGVPPILTVVSLWKLLDSTIIRTLPEVTLQMCAKS